MRRPREAAREEDGGSSGDVRRQACADQGPAPETRRELSLSTSWESRADPRASNEVQASKRRGVYDLWVVQRAAASGTVAAADESGHGRGAGSAQPARLLEVIELLD